MRSYGGANTLGPALEPIYSQLTYKSNKHKKERKTIMYRPDASPHTAEGKIPDVQTNRKQDFKDHRNSTEVNSLTFLKP